MENEETIKDQSFATTMVKIGAMCSAAGAVGWLASYAVFAAVERRAAEKALRELDEIFAQK